MNRVYTFIICCILSLQLHAQEKPTVIASCSMIADMCKNICGDILAVDMIVPVGGDPHIYEPTPSDARKVSSGDIVFINGLTFEGWIGDLIENAASKAPVVTVTEGIEPIRSDKYQNSADPHAWMDLELAQTYILNIKDALVALYPKYENEFEQNYQRYQKQIKDLDQYILSEVKKIDQQKRVLITSHDAFAYYGKRYGIQLEALMGISTESDARTSDIIRVSRIIKERKVPAIFIESTINPKLIKQISDDSGAKIGGELFADSLGEEDSDADTYINMLKHNTDVIVGALSRGEIQETKIDADDQSQNWLLYGLLALLLIGGLLFMASRINKT